MTRTSSARAAAVVTTAGWLVTGACAHLSGRAPAPIEGEWNRTVEFAQSSAAAGRFDVADSALAAFAAGHAGSTDALETEYWRAVFALDPANHEASLAAAVGSLDAYLGDPRPRRHVAEATILRRVAGRMDDLAKQVAEAHREATVNARAATEPPKPVESPAAEAEIKRLKDELAKANAELDRIRKRLANPAKP